jgi:hypothetical protein
MILDKSEAHIEENHKYLHGINSLLPDIHLFCLVPISGKQCDMLLQGQKSMLKYGAHRISKTVVCNIAPLMGLHVHLLHSSHNYYWQQTVN